MKNTRRTNLIIILLLATVLVLASCNPKTEDEVPYEVNTDFDNGFFGIFNEKNIYVTSIGQAYDCYLVASQVSKAGVTAEFDKLLCANDVANNSVVLVTVGCSYKSMSENGVTLESELNRAKEFVSEKQSKNITLIAVHIGESARRGPLSDKIIDYVFANADYDIFTKGGNSYDGKTPDYKLSNVAIDGGVKYCQLDSFSVFSSMLRHLKGETNA